MKYTFIICLVLFAVILTSCNIPEKVTEEMARTIVASTLEAKVNAIGSMTPPTPTPTNTEIPTETPTPTITPTPTLEPTPTWIYHERGSAQVLILYYHDVVKDSNDDKYYQWEFDSWYVKPIEFEQQMRILNEMKYTTITIADLVKVVYEGGELPERPVLITFDSTELGQWKNAYPIMKKYGQVGNLLVNANHVGAKNSLSVEQINTLLDEGWGIGSSGDDAQDPGVRLADRGRWSREIGGSKTRIEETFEGLEVQGFAYPDGYTDPEGEIIRRVSNTYKIAFSRLPAQLTDEVSFNNIFFVPRVEITGGTSYNDFFSKLPWKEGEISKETMEWTIPTPTLEPEFVEMTKQAQESLIAADNQ
ncbi:MAG: polysaccharide deacetylase family protein [Flexilinea sp.]|nr:polysaccharide deacetylase family protein [Flexilinea sp.]